MKRWFFLCFFFSCFSFFCFGETLALKDKLATADVGSYLVIEQNKTFTFFYINAKSDKKIVIEEVSVPAALFSQQRMPSWRAWFESGAPGNSSWLISQINLATGQFEEMFSYTHQGWINVSESNAFLCKLLNLPFSPVPMQERRKVGLPPGYNSPDRRPLWHPRIIFEGKILKDVTSSAWKARWPSDGSELSRKVIEIYMPNSDASSSLPVYFPFWIEVEGKIGSAKVRVVDSGKGAKSPKGQLPLRAPQVVGEKLTKEGLEITLESPSYFQEFDIMAEGLDSFGQFFPLPCKTERKGDKTSLFIPMRELAQEMQHGESYRFLICAKDDPTVCIETTRPFLFPQKKELYKQ